MLNINFWENYDKISTISVKSYEIVYKGLNKKTGKYVLIKEIDKTKYNIECHSSFKKEEIIEKIKDIQELIMSIDSKDYFYIVMELFLCDLEYYIKIKPKFTSFEIQDILIQLNKDFKIMKNKNKILSNLTFSSILLYSNNLNKLKFSLSNYNFFEKSENTESTMFEKDNYLVLPPEILKGNYISEKSDIWSLGIIIYYLYFNKYPFYGINEYKLIQDIESDKILETFDDKNLNDLVNRMLVIDQKERISWEEYFNHPFLKNNISKEYPKFNFMCQVHNENINLYCFDCKCNICELCDKHITHKTVSFSKIGFNQSELSKIEYLMKEISNNLEKINEINQMIEKIKIIKENNSIYEKDINNNYKQYYINYLEVLNANLKEGNQLNLIEFNNSIKCKYTIKDNNINERILNCVEEIKREHLEWNILEEGNEKEIKENFELYLNNKKVDFCYEYLFQNNLKKNILEIKLKKPIKNMSYIFYENTSLTSLDLSHFNSYYLNNIKNMFYECISLNELNISNFYSSNIVNMSCMFYYCSSLKSLYLSNFNTNNIINMNGMFFGCSSLTSLDLSSFNTKKVIHMSYMFNKCSSLTNINLSSFDTLNVKEMNGMFSECSSLKILDLSSFNTDNTTNISHMFYNCTSLISLDLSNFNTINVKKMNNLFSGCSSLESLNLYNFSTKNVNEMNELFNNLNKNCNVILNDRNLLNELKRNINTL